METRSLDCSLTLSSVQSRGRSRWASSTVLFLDHRLRSTCCPQATGLARLPLAWLQWPALPSISHTCSQVELNSPAHLSSPAGAGGGCPPHAVLLAITSLQKQVGANRRSNSKRISPSVTMSRPLDATGSDLYKCSRLPRMVTAKQLLLCLHCSPLPPPSLRVSPVPYGLAHPRLPQIYSCPYFCENKNITLTPSLISYITSSLFLTQPYHADPAGALDTYAYTCLPKTGPWIVLGKTSSRARSAALDSLLYTERATTTACFLSPIHLLLVSFSLTTRFFLPTSRSHFPSPSSMTQLKEP